MKKQTTIILSTSLIVLTLAIVGGLFFYYSQNTLPGSIIPSTCSLQNNGVKTISYTCPSTVSSCNAILTLDCATQTTQPKVVLRWSSNVFNPSQIAVDGDGDGNLDRFVSSTTQIAPSQVTLLQRFPAPIDASYVGKYGNVVIVCSPSNTGGTACKQYNIGGTIPTSSSPTEPYTSSGLEKNDGTINTYQCTQSYSGSQSGTVTYSANKAGSINKSLVLQPSQLINWNGKITYSESTTKPSQCTQNKADATYPNRFYTCSLDSNGCGLLSQSYTLCNPTSYIYNEVEQKCTPPYNLQLTLDNTLFSTQQPITGNVEIKDTTQKDFIQMRIVLKDQLGNVKQTLSPQTRNGIATFSFLPQPSLGKYTIEASTVNYLLGDSTKVQEITITQPIFMRLSSYPDQIQYIPNLITARAFITDIDGNPENIASWDFSGTTCGNKDVSDKVLPNRIGSNSKDGTIYELTTPILEECLFTYKVVAIDNSGFKSAPSIITISVKKSQIVIQQVNFPIDKDEGRYTLVFKTLDVNAQPIDTENSIVIQDSDGCESGKFCLIDNKNYPAIQVISTGNKGEYQFTSTFKPGGNKIIITSSSATIQSNTQEFSLTFFPKSPGGGGTGGGTNWSLIISGIVAVSGIGIFIWLISRKRKRR